MIIYSQGQQQTKIHFPDLPLFPSPSSLPLSFPTLRAAVCLLVLIIVVTLSQLNLLTSEQTTTKKANKYVPVYN